MKQLIDNIERVNNLIYNTLYKGRDFWGEEWNDTSIYKDGMTGARANFQVMKGECEDCLNFAKYDFYWSGIRKDLEFREVESAGYAKRLQSYFEKFCSKVYKTDYGKLKSGTFTQNLLEDGYITDKEADEYCRLLAEVAKKTLSDACRAYRMILDIAEPNHNQTLLTPALDQLFLNCQKGLREKFTAFFSESKREGIELDATNVILMLKMILGNDLKDCLSSNKIQLKTLWNEFRSLGLIRNGVDDSTLDKARRNENPPKPDIVRLWNEFE